MQTPLALTTFDDRIGHPAWRDRPTWYVVSTRDRAVSVELQRALAARLQARTTELPASHMSLLSMPDAVAEVIAQAAAAISASPA